MYLLDTNVVSEMRQGRTATVARWLDAQRATDLFTSVIVMTELELGVRRVERRDTRQGHALRMWLDEMVPARFERRILIVDLAVALRAAQFHVPDPSERHDALIGATAAVHDLTLVTRNVRDFERFGIPTVNPWEAAA